MTISKIYKGTAELTNVLKIYKGSELIYEKQSGPPAYLTFQSPSPFTLNVNNSTKNWDGTLEYSTDTTTWSTWSGTTTLSSINNKLYLRGSNNTLITGTTSDYKWILTGTNIDCIGNIENLLDYVTVTNGNHPTMADYCYYYMFDGCTSLTTAPELPATTLANYCYRNMFNGCTGLTTAPSLPALNLADNCYRNMFRGCTGLTTAPSLPALNLADYCYASMFYGCTSLTTAPSLPATTLADYCYYYMFDGCTSLTTAPELPATTMVISCYNSMFARCTGLKVSTTKTGSYQYAWRIPTSGTGTTASNWNYTMLQSTGGTFKSNPTINTTYYVENAPV